MAKRNSPLAIFGTCNEVFTSDWGNRRTGGANTVVMPKVHSLVQIRA